MHPGLYLSITFDYVKVFVGNVYGKIGKFFFGYFHFYFLIM
jgi:hypothetical protein